MTQSELDFEKVCRACLSETDTMKDLFSECSPDVYKFCTSVEIFVDDSLPKSICHCCLDLLNKMYSFKQVVMRSDTILKQQVTVKLKVNIKNLQNQCNDFGTSVVESPVPMPDALDVDAEALQQNEKPIQDLQKPKVRKKRGPYRKRGTLIMSKKKRRMKCVQCDKHFHKYENLEAHMRSHFGKLPDIKCKLCDKTFLNLRSLNSHLRVHNGVRKYQCLTCGKNFTYLNVLKSHEMIHAGIKNHVCHICDAKFIQPYNLKIHLDTHKNQKKFVCFQCGKKFAQAGNLKTHLIRHTGVKNIACTMCDMKFYIKGDLLKHMRSHSVEKPYLCEFCDKTFKNKSFLNIHMRTHTGERPYCCDICPKRFMSPKDLKNHRMIHTGEKPHKCPLCTQAFIQKCALNRHMKSHSKKVEENQGIIVASQIHKVVNIGSNMLNGNVAQHIFT